MGTGRRRGTVSARRHRADQGLVGLVGRPKVWTIVCVRFHQLRIALADIEPSIWRTVNVPSHATLEELHRIIQAAMGWLDYHLHAFEIGERRYQLPDPEGDGDEAVLDERDVTLRDLPEGTHFRYEYDFGDEWIHDISVERVHELDHDLAFCVAGAGACPPEDCGGAHGYQELVKIIADRNQPAYQETIAWLGDSYVPRAFTLQAVNSALVALYRDPPERPRPRISRKRATR